MSSIVNYKIYLPISIDTDTKVVNFPIVFLRNKDEFEEYLASQDSVETIETIYPTKVQSFNTEDINIDLLTASLEEELDRLNASEADIMNLLQKIVVIDKLVSLQSNVVLAKSLKGKILGLPIQLKKANYKNLTAKNNTLRKNMLIKLESFIKTNEPIEKFNEQLGELDEPVLTKYSGDRLLLDRYILPNRKSFPEFINSEFTLKTKSDESKRLPIKIWDNEKNKFNSIQPFEHQKFVSDYLNENTPYRGMLLYHGLGSGKSGASILVGEGFPNRKVVVMLPASIRTNYLDEISTFGEVAYKTHFYWQFIQLGEANTTNEDRFMEFFKSIGIPNELYLQLRSKIGLGDNKGLWLVDYNKQPNYDSLSEIQKKSLDAQISIMFKHKYTFCNYNAGKYTIIKILEQLVPGYETIKQRLLGDKTASQLNKNDIDEILNYIYDPKNNIDNPFDNKVVIVDEIHNLTSGMLGSGFNSPRIYELIMRAKNLKLVLLSGTPVINFPFELGLMLNMLRGFIKTIQITVSKKDGVVNPAEIDRLLTTNKYIDRYIINGNSIKLVRTPVGFMNIYNEGNDNIGVTKDTSEEGISYLNDDDFTLYFRGYLNENMYRIDTTPKLDYLTVFPDILNKRNYNSIMVGNTKYQEGIEKLFNDTYINNDATELKNETAFKNRILGLISFYNEVSSPEGEDPIFPNRITAEEDETEVFMSDYQFIEYLEFREIEREKELQSSKLRKMSTGNGDVLDNISKLFKVYTRQRGIFVFPPNVSRPLPPKKDRDVFSSNEERNKIVEELLEIIRSESNIAHQIANYISELDEKKATAVQDIFSSLVKKRLNLVGDDSNAEEELSQYDWGDETTIQHLEGITETTDESLLDYNTQLELAISKLTEENLTINGSAYDLASLSPKYVKILENIISSNGKSFIYSQFRAVEGIEIFGKVLEINGYTKVEITDNGLDEKITVENSTIKVGKRVRIIRDRTELNDDTYLSKSYRVISEEEQEDGRKLFGLEDMDDEMFESDQISLCKFALWTGSESVDARKTILNIYNSTQNLLGEKCQILMTTQSGAEGISLSAVRQVHIMEPYWNNVRIEQVIGRARRTNSHNDLPVKMRNVKVYKYVIKFNPALLSTIDGNYVERNQGLITDYLVNRNADMIEDVRQEQGAEEESDEHVEIAKARFNHHLMTLINSVVVDDNGITTDEVLVNISDKKELILNKFLKLFKEVAVDCKYNMIENIRSDSDLESLSCYDLPLNDDPEFTFSLDSAKILEPSYVESASEAQEEVIHKIEIVPIKLAGKFIKIMISLPADIDSFRDLRESTPIYEAYSYLGLNPDTKLMYGSKYLIGNIVIESGKRQFKFIKDKLNLEVIKKLNNIYQCSKELGNIPSFEDEKAEYLLYKNRLEDCYNQKMGIAPAAIEPDTWKCSLCEEDNPVDISVCSNCGMDR